MPAPSALLRRLFDAAVASAQPALCVPPHLPKKPPGGRLVVIGAGKASAAMARAVEDHWPGPLEGLVVTRYGHGVPCQRVEIVEAAHPVPDRAGVAAAERMLDLVRGLGQDDVVLCLISGGGSSLLVSPAEGLTLADKQTVNSALLRSGATISEMNCLRRHLSSIKGGRLAAACHPARVINLLISDVPGRPVDRHRIRADRRRPDDLRRRARDRFSLRHRPARGRAAAAGDRRGETQTGRPAAADRRDDLGRRAATGPRSRGRGRPERRLCGPHPW